MFFAKTVTVAAALAVANAHQFMKNPVPFPSQNLLNGPLEADGSNFPCKSTGPVTYTGGQVNTYAKGSTQTLETLGSVVHGGGSCQISITYDSAPTKDSVWKVIHSIEGGCPSRTQTGNYPANDALFPNPDTYDFKIPTDIPAGKGVIAWTWINQVGNREFYMYCAAVEITGEGGTQEAFEKLPDMTIMNIGGETLGEGKTPKFAQAGTSLEDNLSGHGAQLVQNTFKFGSGGSGGAPPPAGGSSAYPTASVPGGVFITQTPTAAPTVAPTATESASATVYPTSVVEAPTSTTSAAPYPTGGAGSGSGAQTGACTNEGTFNCIDGTSYQQCASGAWSVVMQLSAGTKCTPGQSAGMSIDAAGKKRRARALRA